MGPLASVSDVEDVWRPLTNAETGRVFSLIVKASALLRHLMPQIDARIGLSVTDPTSARALDPVIVADVVATAVKSYLVNPDGLTQLSETAGPFIRAASYATAEGGGELGFTPSLLARLQPSVPLSEVHRPVRTKPGLAPWPLGRYGGPNPYGQDFPDVIVPAVYGGGAAADASVPHPSDEI